MSFSFSLPSSPPPSYREATREEKKKAVKKKAKSKNRISAEDRWSVKFRRMTTSLGLNKNYIEWKIVDNDDTDYKVELYHSTFGGKRVVIINGTEYVNKKIWFDNGARYEFKLKSNTVITVSLLAAGMAGFDYEIYVNGSPYETAKEIYFRDVENK